LLSEEDLFARILKVKNLKENCFKYLEESSKKLLTQKILFAMAELTAEKMGPVKLSEIALKSTGINDKLKQDLVRLTIEKSLLKCGLVEKLKYASNDVRYILTAYRFQKIKEIDSFRGESSQPIGDVLELPKSSWPLSNDFYLLLIRKHGYEQALKKLNSDFDNDLIPRGKYETLNSNYTKLLGLILEKLGTKYSGLESLVVTE
jgi:predicted transcriptional regulator with HTH domain